MRGLLLVLLLRLANALPLDFLDGCPEGTHVAVMPSGERYCRWCEPGTYQAEESTKSEAAKEKYRANAQTNHWRKQKCNTPEKPKPPQTNLQKATL
jgi:hypothetical protein